MKTLIVSWPGKVEPGVRTDAWVSWHKEPYPVSRPVPRISKPKKRGAGKARKSAAK